MTPDPICTACLRPIREYEDAVWADSPGMPHSSDVPFHAHCVKEDDDQEA